MNKSMQYLEKLLKYNEINIDCFGTYRLLIATIILNLNESILTFNKEELEYYKQLLIRYTNLKRTYRKYLKAENRSLRQYKQSRLEDLKSRVNK